MDYRKSRKQNEKVRLCKLLAATISLLSTVGVAAFAITASAYQEKEAEPLSATYHDTTLTGTIELSDVTDDTPERNYTTDDRFIPLSYELKFNACETILLDVEDSAVSEDNYDDDVDPLSYIIYDETEESTTEESAIAESAIAESAAEVPVVTEESVTEVPVVTEESTTEEPVATQTVSTASQEQTVSTISQEQTIYSFENLYLDITDVRKPSNMTLEQLQKWTKRFAPNWVGLESQILEYDKRINLVFLLAVARAETGAGATDAMVANYNCFNIKGKSGYVNYGSYLESIDDFVNLITSAYLAEDGIYFNGYGICDIGVMYAGLHWGPGVITLADELIWHFDEGSLSE